MILHTFFFSFLNFLLTLGLSLTQQLRNRYFRDCGHHLAFTVLAIYRAGQRCGKDQVDFQFKFMITNSAGPGATTNTGNIYHTFCI
jgi:hypothetical protein